MKGDLVFKVERSFEVVVVFVVIVGFVRGAFFKTGLETPAVRQRCQRCFAVKPSVRYAQTAIRQLARDSYSDFWLAKAYITIAIRLRYDHDTTTTKN